MKKSSDLFGLQRELDRALQQLPKLALEHLLAKKLASAGIDVSEGLPAGLTEHVFNGSNSTFQWDDGSSDNRGVSIDISDDDVRELETDVLKVVEGDLVQKLSADIAGTLLRSIRNRWKEDSFNERLRFVEFHERLHERWGRAFGLLRMLLVVCGDIGGNTIRRLRRSKGVGRHLILRLHARSCQITSEIITLLEHGFADGAMARWRTLHEIAVVIILIDQHGDELARRYVDHVSIESKRSADAYEHCGAQLGYRPLSNRERIRINRQFTTAVKKYGSEFGAPYGWAAYHLQKKQPTLADLERAAGRAMMRSHYKLASQNVHAGPQGLFFRLGALGQSDVLLAGPSNAGLSDPGSLTAYSICLVTLFLMEGRAFTLDDLVAMKLIISLRDDVSDAFVKADRRLVRAERAAQKERVRHH